MKKLAFLAVLFAAAHLHAGTPVVFDGPRFVSVPGIARDVRAADFDNDGKRDFVVASGESISVYRGNGDGTFALPATMALGQTDLRFDVGLLDGDAFPDLVVGAGDVTRLYRGNGDGSFTAGAQLLTPSWCPSEKITLAELTSDGLPDVVVCGSVFRNFGNGNFAAAQLAGLGAGYFADVNRDGRLDAFVSSSDIFWALRLGNGNGTFGPAVDLEDSGISAAGDFNGDGRADYAWIDSGRHDLAVRLRNGDGTYGARISAGFVSEDRNVVLRTADVNGDGRADIIGTTAGHVLVSITGADGAPGAPQMYVAAPGAFEFALADFNGDGLADLVTAGWGDPWSSRGAVTFLRGTAGGTFAAARGALLSTPTLSPGYFYGIDPAEVGVDDVTGDAKPDAIVLTRAGIVVLPGTGQASFAAPIRTAVSGVNADAGVYNGTFGDFTGDGADDVIFSLSGEFACYAANGDGTFRHTATLDAAGYGSLPRRTAGDFGGDGKLDIVIDRGEGLQLFRGRGDGTFDAPVTTGFRIPYGEPPLAGDVNGDGADDLVLAQTILLGSSAARFTEISYNSYDRPSTLVDLDDDGHLDIVKYDYFVRASTMTILLGNGDGTFGPIRQMQVDQRGGPHPLTRGLAGDFNADGDVDLAFGTTILLGDGAGSFDGYARFRYSSTLTHSALGDFDGNGTPDLVLVDGQSNVVDIVPTLTSESLDLPITVAITTAPATYPAGAEFYVTVASEGAGVFATSGGVAVAVGGTIAALAELVNGTAYAEVRAYVPGTQALTAVFGGDSVYAGTVAAPRNIEITRASIWSYATSTPQSPTTQTPVRVIGQLESGMLTYPAGEVVITVDGVERGRGPAASFDIEIGLLAVGRRIFTLSYPGDSLHQPYTQNWAVNVVKPAAPVALSISPASSTTAGTSVTLTATFPNHPTLSGGTVAFSWNAKTVATVPVVNGSASVTTSNLDVASTYLYASYSGNETYRSSGTFTPYTVNDVPLASAPRSFYLVEPCRILDTRGPAAPTGGPPIESAVTRAIPIAGLCGIPKGAAAVAINITVVAPQNVGFLTLFPGASPRPGTSTLNYRTGRTRANSAIMPLSAGGRVNVFNSGPAGVHVLIDVTGYFQ